MSSAWWIQNNFWTHFMWFSRHQCGPIGHLGAGAGPRDLASEAQAPTLSLSFPVFLSLEKWFPLQSLCSSSGKLLYLTKFLRGMDGTEPLTVFVLSLEICYPGSGGIIEVVMEIRMLLLGSRALPQPFLRKLLWCPGAELGLGCARGWHTIYSEVSGHSDGKTPRWGLDNAIAQHSQFFCLPEDRS